MPWTQPKSSFQPWASPNKSSDVHFLILYDEMSHTLSESWMQQLNEHFHSSQISLHIIQTHAFWSSSGTSSIISSCTHSYGILILSDESTSVSKYAGKKEEAAQVFLEMCFSQYSERFKTKSSHKMRTGVINKPQNRLWDVVYNTPINTGIRHWRQVNNHVFKF